jgi:hypothetical protein
VREVGGEDGEGQFDHGGVSLAAEGWDEFAYDGFDKDAINLFWSSGVA